MEFIVWAAFGLIFGVISRFIMPGKDTGNWIVTLALGIIGAVIGGFSGQKLGFESHYKSGLGYLFTAFVGSAVLLVIYRLFLNKKAA